MIESTLEVLEGLKHAIQAEADGYMFYLLAAEKTKDETGRKMFRILADEELLHKDVLIAQYKSVAVTGHIDINLNIGRQFDFSSNEIFSPEIKNRINESQFEMSALSIGITLEMSSMDYYKKQAGKSSDTAIKAFFNELAGWEQMHYQALLRQQEMLQDDFWSQGGFAPF
ncbi:MAG: ferritin family protein [bacterium]|nr:ferritin family protein [bacterium]